MKQTKNLYLNKPDTGDYVKVNDFNKNADTLDEYIFHLEAMLNSKAPIKSPRFLGNPVIFNMETKEDDAIATVPQILSMLEVETF